MTVTDTGPITLPISPTAASTHYAVAARDAAGNVSPISGRTSIPQPPSFPRSGTDTVAPSAPGNPEHYEFFASLCLQLGRNDEGLDALRRAARVNPNESKVLLTLAETLAAQFRTEEAVEIYLRAFEKSPEQEDLVASSSSDRPEQPEDRDGPLLAED